MGRPLGGALLLALLALALTASDRPAAPVAAQGPGSTVIALHDNHHDVSPPLRALLPLPLPVLVPTPAAAAAPGPIARDPSAVAAMPPTILNFDGIASV